ncbi:acyl carrier protein [Streptomyces sp. NRRL B-1347]|uniref:acyl carrier protein n=1 Tax=Streptomyces sp. NRRL B-1347 TaxID=1476877 RepID=UPI0004C6B9A0|nr:phosphopantetheine-binding protein [Streptomyces sp. NRRL B-1347]
MRAFTLEDLVQVLGTVTSDAVDVDEGRLDTDLTVLNVDSLAMVEAADRLQETYRLTIPDDDVSAFRTPRDLLEYMNRRLAEGSGVRQ